MTAEGLAEHYRSGLESFHDAFVPHLKARLWSLSGGTWALADYHAYACGSDVDLMTHVVNAANLDTGCAIYPGDWYGFSAGALQRDKLIRSIDAQGRLACLCIPSVRNGHLTAEMATFLEQAEACLLNINLYPTLTPAERREAAVALDPVLRKSVISVSFSRGFGLTASQLGVILIHKGHPLRAAYHEQWTWLTYFHNAIAARAFMELDVDQIMAVDDARRAWVMGELEKRGLLAVTSGSYYVKSFRVESDVPEHIRPLYREGLVRLCFKPPQH